MPLCMLLSFSGPTIEATTTSHIPRHARRQCHELCNKRSAVAEMGDRFATDMGRKVGGGLLCPFLLGELGFYLTQCRLGRGLP